MCVLCLRECLPASWRVNEACHGLGAEHLPQPGAKLDECVIRVCDEPPRVIVGWSTTVMWPWLSAVADDTQGKDASVPYVLLVMVVFLIYAL